MFVSISTVWISAFFLFFSLIEIANFLNVPDCFTPFSSRFIMQISFMVLSLVFKVFKGSSLIV